MKASKERRAVSGRVIRPLAAVLVVLAVVAVGPAHEASGATWFTATKPISREHFVAGQDQLVDARAFTLRVNETSSLRGHQIIDVTWSGARPTGGVVRDPHGTNALQQEYPVVLLQCRGIDSPGAAEAERLDPSTCWTAASDERFQAAYTSFPSFRDDRYAAPEDRRAAVGEPQPRPAACFGAAPAEHWVPFRAADGTVYPGGSSGCGGMAPEASNVGGLDLPSNTTYGATSADGTGRAKFDVWTKEENASLGCTLGVPCALVAVPIEGISCDTAAAGLPVEDQPLPPDQTAEADADCQATGQYQPGQARADVVRSDLAVSGALWWAASNWRNRVSVPLTFAPPSNACDVVAGPKGIDIYGSELMTQAMLQWTPRFCLDQALFRVKHVQTPEPQARNLLRAGGVEATLASDVPPDGYPKPVVYAPVAVTGFAISFAIDDANHEPVDNLKLTPRLLAKLLTESYPANSAVKQAYGALAGNPLNITFDPEFKALNAGIVNGAESAGSLFALSSDSDVMHALTAYITADPEARAWLDGAPDPWGTVVNPNYKGIELPTESWPLRESFGPSLYAANTNFNPCLSANPVPYLPLVAAPAARLAAIAQGVEFAVAPGKTNCSYFEEAPERSKLSPAGRQQPGARFVIGVTSLADTQRYELSNAALQTGSAEQRAFVAPSDASVRAAAGLLVPDGPSRTWPIPYDAMRTPAGAAAYPGTMVVYDQVPTSGLPAADAAQHAQFLRFAVHEGQAPGAGNGQLPAGYLPVTAANGLGALAAYTDQAADAVQAQAGVIPPVVEPPPVESDPSAVVPSAGSTDFGSSGGFTPSSSGSSAGPSPRSSSSSATPTEESAVPIEAVSSSNPLATQIAAATIAAVAFLIGAFLPGLGVLVVVAGFTAGVLYVANRRKAAA